MYECVCICGRVRMCMRMCIRMCVPVYVYAYVYVHLYVCMCTYIFMDVCLHVSIGVFM